MKFFAALLTVMVVCFLSMGWFVGAPFHAVVEAAVQRARPVLLTALAAILAFIPLTHSQTLL